MTLGERRRLMFGHQGARQDEADESLLHHIGGCLARARLQPPISGVHEPETVRVEKRGLAGVADIELEMIDAFDRAEILHDLEHISTKQA
jgi:hypothetical protein